MGSQAASGKYWVARHIETRVKRGAEWHSKIDSHKKLVRATTPSYIRILGDGFRPVSISDANPCGRLLEADKEQNREIKRCASLTESVIQKALSARTERPAANKPEHQLQAFLIRSALQSENFGRLDQKSLGISEVFDELIFITDELNVEAGESKCRLDMVALGCKSGLFFPVFIELKNGREFKRLNEQLDNACRMLWKNEDARVRSLFAEFLSAVSGVKIENISQEADTAKKIIIWPKSSSGKEAEKVTKARDRNLLIVEFELTYKFSQRFR